MLDLLKAEVHGTNCISIYYFHCTCCTNLVSFKIIVYDEYKFLLKIVSTQSCLSIGFLRRFFVEVLLHCAITHFFKTNYLSHFLLFHFIKIELL